MDDMTPNIPNQPGIELNVTAWTGSFRPGRYKSYYCTSRQIRVGDDYPREAKERLERLIGWEIIQTVPEPVRDGKKKSWEIVRRARFTLDFPEPVNVWAWIRKFICEDFSRPSQVLMQVQFIDRSTKPPAR